MIGMNDISINSSADRIDHIIQKLENQWQIYCTSIYLLNILNERIPLIGLGSSSFIINEKSNAAIEKMQKLIFCILLVLKNEYVLGNAGTPDYYWCSEPLVYYSTLTASSSLPTREPDKALLDGFDYLILK
ncbi:hypothetical protein Anas_01664 [Armadillidium nasatum]|uniref:Uncharacterized protein n=1 Tax=Armadillidium nasatum TaxID=96803 RepID=A0A5N5TIY2_9CRUS|nr:hypothetical protein Anas_01664 [Armadillidium nasatum]